jgi:hypothetical protein
MIVTDASVASMWSIMGWGMGARRRPRWVRQHQAGTTRFAGRASVPYAGAVPDGGRHGFTAAVAVAAPIV